MKPAFKVDPAVIEMMVRDHIPHCRALGVRVVSVDAERAVLKLDWDERLVGHPDTGVLHGGVITTLIDTVCGMAVQVALMRMTAIATLDLRIDYLRPSTPRKELLAEASCYKLTRNIAFVRARAWNDDPDDPVANCVATFMIDSSDKAPIKRAPKVTPA